SLQIKGTSGTHSCHKCASVFSLGEKFDFTLTLLFEGLDNFLRNRGIHAMALRRFSHYFICAFKAPHLEISTVYIEDLSIFIDNIESVKAVFQCLTLEKKLAR